MEEEKEEKRGFKVVDKRIFAPEAEAKEEEVKEKAKKEPKQEAKEETKGREGEGAKTEEPPPLPEATFSTFIYSLSTSALIHLGEIPEPTTEKVMKSLPLAKQTIDILAILQEKTKGNLAQDEETLLNTLLYDLRIRYVKAVG